MQRLILLRHAEAEQNGAGGDVHRALTARGHADARAAGQALAARGFVPGLALVSSARRAVETWEAAAPAFPAARMRLEARLYNDSAEGLFAAARAAGADAVLLVAHNPGLQMLALELAVRAGAPGLADARQFPPAAAAVFGFAGGAPRFEALILPEAR
jgi:phosphohistidine phosphatase